MTLFGQIPSERALDRNDMPECMNAPWWDADGRSGPWNPAQYITVSPPLKPGPALAFWMLSGYWTTTGPAAAACHIEEYATGWNTFGHTDCILAYNYTYYHEVLNPNAQVWTVAPDATQHRLGIYFGGSSDTYDFAQGFILQVEA